MNPILFLFIIGAIISWDFVIQYGFRAKWYTHPYGKITLGFKTVIALIMSTIVFNSFFHHYPGRDVIRNFQYGLFVFGLVILDVFLHFQLRKSDDTTESDNTREDSPTTNVGHDSRVPESDR